MPTRRALLIGINRYRYVNDLKGCENDVRDLQEVLQTQYAFSDFRTLLSEQATGTAMRAAFTQLVEDAATDDVILIYYAGHGSQMTDVDGDEVNGFDNTLMPFDSKHDPAEPELNTDLLDDELAEVMEALTQKTPNVTVIVDACYSGTILRDASELMAEGTGVRVTGVRGAPRYAGPVPTRVKSRVRFTPSAREHATYALIASCRDDEKAKEIAWPQHDGSLQHHGGFSYYFIARLRALTSTPTLRDLFEGAAADLFDLLGQRQRPQLEGRVDRRLFGLESDTPMRHLRVRTTPNEANQLTLAGGSVVGIGAGARVAIYPPGTLRVEGNTPLARGTVIEVRAVESMVQLDTNTEAVAIPQTARVVLEEAGPLRHTRAVVLAPLPTAGVTDAMAPALDERRRALHALLASDANMRVLEGTAPDALVVSLRVASPAANEWQWEITSANGQPVSPLLPLDAIDAVHHNCAVLTRQWLVGQLTNPAANSPLRSGKVSVDLLTAPKAGEMFTEAVPGPEGLPVVRHGDMPFGLRVRNGHTQGVYVSLLELSFEGGVRQTFPQNGARSETPVKPGEDFKIFTKRGQRRGYSLPDYFPWTDAVATLRLFVSEQPVDVGFLCADETLVTGALAPNATRRTPSDFVGIVPPSIATATPDSDWTVIDIRFLVRRDPTLAPSRPT